MQIEGFEVKDARRNATFRILPRDVAGARSKKPDKCAAALGCRRSFHADEVRVYMSRVYVRKGKQWTRYITPHSLAREIVALDRGGSFVPGTYPLTRPHEGARLGVDTRSGRSGPKSGKKRQARRITKNVRLGPAWKTKN